MIEIFSLCFTMTINDSATLSTLIAAYDRSVLFAESLPSAFRLAKLFSAMGVTNGGLVLLGVEGDGRVSGVDGRELDRIYRKFERLCGDLTDTRVEIGTLRIEETWVVFLVFNPIRKHLDPLDYYMPQISRVEMI